MSISPEHSFHIPVMGLAFTIDTPAKVARFGISSVVSVIEDSLTEQMRKHYCYIRHEKYIPIEPDEEDYRAKRITAYLNMLNKIVTEQMEQLRKESFDGEGDLVKYFELLPDESVLKQRYLEMKHTDGNEKLSIQDFLRKSIVPGCVDVNIMTKVDKVNYSPAGETLPPEYSDALSALRGFAMSNLSSSVVFSAGLNPRLYGYCETFPDFFPDKQGEQKKKIIIKVSDYRSALIQGKFFAKKGLWVSEFRIESGLNCGGHAFATDGLLLGPVMEEFKTKRAELAQTLFEMCNEALAEKGKPVFEKLPALSVTVQGGVGTSHEQRFLLEYYGMDSVGWGSPFLLVPEATNVDSKTLGDLAGASKEDYFLSDASPLGVPFNNFKKSSSEVQRKNRIEKHRAGSPCYLKFLAFNTEFTPKPICVASREYQHLKIKQLTDSIEEKDKLQQEIDKVTAKDCLCEGLSATAFLTNHIPHPHKLHAVTICPGPNLAYFSGVYKLSEMVDHIYGRMNILNALPRSHVFVNELRLYIDYLKKEVEKNWYILNKRKAEYFQTFKENLLQGIHYYREIIPTMTLETTLFRKQMGNELAALEQEIRSVVCSN